MRRHHQHEEPVRNPEEGAVQRRLPDHRQGVQTVLPEGEEEPRWDPDAAPTSQSGVPTIASFIWWTMTLRHRMLCLGRHTELLLCLDVLIWPDIGSEKLSSVATFPPPDGVRIRNKCSVWSTSWSGLICLQEIKSDVYTLLYCRLVAKIVNAGVRSSISNKSHHKKWFVWSFIIIL